jgi:hypothetical protein
MPDTQSPAVTVETAGPGSNVGDKIDTAGMALGDLVKHVGVAVAATQARLNDSCAATANSLATTTVDIIAVRHTDYNDDGTYAETSGNIMMPLPLVNFVDPVNYEMTEVHLQGVFQASEIRSASSYGTDSSRGYAGASLHLGGFFGGASLAGGLNAATSQAQNGSGSGYGSVSSTSSDYGSSSRTETEFGQVRMNAQMTPRNDIGVPKPRHIIRGPSLLLVPLGVATEPRTPTAEAPLEERRVIVKASYVRRPTAARPAGEPIANASFTVETSGLDWSYCSEAGVPDDSSASTYTKTKANGELFFVVRRRFTPGEDTTPRAFSVSARIGLVSSTIPVTL